MNKLSLAYVAGIIDGEGSICLAKGKRGAWFPRIMVTNTNYELLEALQHQFGGSIQSKKVYPSHWRQPHVWRLQYSKAALFIIKVYPYLLVKHEQAICVKLWEAIRPGSTGRWDQDSLDLIRKQLTWLNERGALARSTPEPMVAALCRKK